MQRIALCGCGTVGKNVLRLIEEQHLPVKVDVILVRQTLSENRKGQKGYYFTDDPQEIKDSPAEILVEVMGGTSLACEIVKSALAKGKKVVTANKALLAENPELINSGARFEAAVAGGIPIIRMLKEAICCDVKIVRGVLNGTCNFMLDEMTRKGCDYSQALKLAQQKGYAEADPAFDVGGIDAAQKIFILSKLAFGDVSNDDRAIFDNCIGIEAVRPVDIQYAKEMGRVVRHMCEARVEKQNAEALLRVACMPVVALEESDLVVQGPMNAIEIDGGMPLVLKGEGAGGIPTANSVVADIMDCCGAGDQEGGQKQRRSMDRHSPKQATSTLGRFFLRFTVHDELGIIASLGEECRKLGINIDSILQRPETGDLCNFVLTTGRTSFENVMSLLNQMEGYAWYDSSFAALLL